MELGESYNKLVTAEKSELASISRPIVNEITVLATSLAQWSLRPTGKDVEGVGVSQEKPLLRRAAVALKMAEEQEATHPGSVALVQTVLEKLSATSGLDLVSENYSKDEFKTASLKLKQDLAQLLKDTVTPWGTPHESTPRLIIENMLSRTSALLVSHDYYSHLPEYSAEAFERSIAHNCSMTLSVARNHHVEEDVTPLLQRMSDASGVDLVALQTSKGTAAVNSKNNDSVNSK